MRHVHLAKWMEASGRLLLSKTEARVLMFIAARTVLFGKLAERILVSHFMEGVVNEKTGQFITAPWGGNKNAWYAAVKGLESHGFIVVHPVRVGGKPLGTIYEIALDCIFTTTVGDDMSALRQPKRLRSVKKEETSAEVIDFGAVLLRKRGRFTGTKTEEKGGDLLVPNGPRELYKELEVNKLLVSRASKRDSSEEEPVTRSRITRTRIAIDCTAGDPIRNSIQVAIAKTTRALSTKISTAVVGTDISMSDLLATWRKAIVDVSGRTPVVGITRAEFARFKCAIKTYSIDFSWYDFFFWCATNWETLNNKYHSSSKYSALRGGEEGVYLGTSVPCISRMVRHVAKLMRAYSDSTTARSAPHRTTTSEKSVEELQALLATAEREAAMYRNIATQERNRAVRAASRRELPALVNPVMTPEDYPTQEDEEELGGWNDE